MLWHRAQTFAGQFSDVTMVQTRRKRDEAKAELAAQTTFAGGASYGAGNRA